MPNSQYFVKKVTMNKDPSHIIANYWCESP